MTSSLGLSPLGQAPLGAYPLGGPEGVKLPPSYVAMLLTGTTSWSPPASGTYKAILKGPGGRGRQSAAAGGAGVVGGSGAHTEVTFNASFGVPLACVVGAGDSETDTSITLPGRAAAAIAGAGKNASTGGAGGIASGGDYMLNGTAGAASGAGGAGLGPGGRPGGAATNGEAGGPGAPGTLEFPGGAGGENSASPQTSYTPSGHFPGGGAAVNGIGSTSAPTTPSGADGVIYIVRVA